MRFRRKASYSPVELPPYFPPSRYKTIGANPIVDHENQKIWSLPLVVQQNTNNVKYSNHVHIRSLETELENEAENAILGTAATSEDSGIHPGILYGGPAGGVLAPVAVYFYKIFKKRWSKKKQRKGKKKDDDNESEEEDKEETIREALTTAVGNQISNASSSVVNHIKGKIAATGSSLVENLKTQAIAQEDEILDNIKTTILQQEEEMVVNIKEKFATTKTTLIQDIKTKFSIFKKATNINVEDTTFYEKRKEEETLCKLSESEEELRNVVKRRISDAQDALIPEIEKSLEKTSENIIKNIEIQIPEARGHSWDKIKGSMKEMCSTMCADIKSILTCTEKKIIDDLESQMEDGKFQKTVEPTSQSGEVTVEIIQPDFNKKSEVQSELKDEQTAKNLIYNNVAQKEEKEETKLDQINGETVEASRPEFSTPETCEKLVIQEEETLGSCKELNKLEKIKQKISAIHFLRHNVKTAQDTSQKETMDGKTKDEQSRDTTICIDIKQKTSPIPIPCKHKLQLNHFPVNEETIEVKNAIDNNSKASSSTVGEEEENDPSFIERIRSSVPHLPFNLNFSGIPDRVWSFMEPKKSEDTEQGQCELSEVKVINQEDSLLDEENKIDGGKRGISGEDSKDEPKTWIILENNDAQWPSHLPRLKNSPKERELEAENSPVLPNVKWLQLVEEDVQTAWPNHLPKNLHGVNGPTVIQNDKNFPKHKRSKRKEPQIDGSDSQDEDDPKWKKRLSKNIHLKPTNEEDRKKSLVSTISEFSTTSSIESTSSGTQDSLASSKLSYKGQLKKKQTRSKRLKSLDSGIHHYYGKYMSIEFPKENREEGTCSNEIMKDISSPNGMEDGKEVGSEGSSENSQEDVKSVIDTTITKDEDIEEGSAEKETDLNGGGGGCYEGFMVSLGNKKV